ncbi:MAG: NADH-quinone oxidoreductase subunit J [Elusimicrobia bacterium]|nr:NADH-quinone oxidoreductase subunit J [Elusimicrobiota bacterium]
MTLQQGVFDGFAVLTLGSALLVVTQRQILHCALWLIATLGAIAGFYVLLGADFLAAAQVLLYIGGVMVIMLFVIMLSHVPLVPQESVKNAQWLPALLACGLTVIGFGWTIGRVSWYGQELPIATNRGEIFEPTTASLGQLLLTELALPFELVSLVLVAALVGAVFFTRRPES